MVPEDTAQALNFGESRQERLSFPARCFSSPRWIQFNAWVLTMDHKNEPTYLYGDHIFPVLSADGNAVEQFTRRIRRDS